LYLRWWICRGLILSAGGRQSVKQRQQGCAGQQGRASTAAMNFKQHAIDHAMFVATPGHRAALLWQQIAGRLSYENAPRCFECCRAKKTERTATKTISKGRRF
jgi:hypothetical protein